MSYISIVSIVKIEGVVVIQKTRTKNLRNDLFQNFKPRADFGPSFNKIFDDTIRKCHRNFEQTFKKVKENSEKNLMKFVKFFRKCYMKFE